MSCLGQGYNPNPTREWTRFENSCYKIPPIPEPVPPSPPIVNPKVIHTIPVGLLPGAIVSNGTYVWVGILSSDSVSKIDIESHSIITTINNVKKPTTVSYNGTNIWFANDISPSPNFSKLQLNDTVTSFSNGYPNTFGISSDGTYLWLSPVSPVSLIYFIYYYKISDGFVTPTGSIPLSESPYNIVSNGTYVWTVLSGSNILVKIEIATFSVINNITVGTFPIDVCYDNNYVWVVNELSNSVSQVSIATDIVIRNIPVGNYPQRISSDGTFVWVTNGNDNTVSQIEISSGLVINTIPVGIFPSSINSDGTYVWVANLIGSVSQIQIYEPVPPVPVPTPNNFSLENQAMYRKGNILQYKANSSNLTKNQKYSQIARGMWTNRTKTWATQSDKYTNPNTNYLKRNNNSTVVVTNNIIDNTVPTNQVNIDCQPINSNISTYFLPQQPTSGNPGNNPIIPSQPQVQTSGNNFILPPSVPVPEKTIVYADDGGTLLCNSVAIPCTDISYVANNEPVQCFPNTCSDVPGIPTLLCWDNSLQTYYPRVRRTYATSGNKWPQGSKLIFPVYPNNVTPPVTQASISLAVVNALEASKNY